MANRSVVEVIFKVHAAVRVGEEVRVCGNVPELGCNCPERSVPLVTCKADYPCWSSKTSIFLPGENGMVTYRYCIFAGGVFRRWEGQDSISRCLVTMGSEANVLKITADYFGDKDKCYTNVASSSSEVLSQKSTFKTRQYQAWNLGNKIDTNLHPTTDAVIIVSYFLPVILSKSDRGVWSAKWDEENIIALQLDLRTTWVGSVRYKENITPEDEEKIIEVLREMNCNPLFLNPADHHQFYDVFCKNNIWPVLHHIADVYGPLDLNDNTVQAQQDLWITYNKVSLLFRNKVVEVFHEGDLIWIQGFHLMILPSYLRRKVPLAKIGVFFHTPFPSSEIWRTMCRREDLLSGLLSADQVGFHLYEYSRHFLTGCRRMLGFQSEMNPSGMLTINANGRDVVVTSIHAGIDPSRLEPVFLRPSMHALAMEWKNRFPNKIIIAGIDRLERLKGIPLKLLAIEQFLLENPKWRSELAFVLIGVSAGERLADYRQTQHDVKLLVERIMSKFGCGDGPPLIHFEERAERDIALEQRLAFFAAADMLMSTAPRDGLNRLPIEFTLARARCGHLCQIEGSVAVAGAMRPNEGLVIVSEFISCARVMRGALCVNPYRIDEVANSLTRALEMCQTERSERMRRNMEYSLRLTTTAWAMEVLRDLKRVHQTHNIESLGLGAGFRVVGVRAGFHPLDMTALTKTYRTCNRRVILLDWGGTLVQEGEKADKLHFYAVAQGHATRTGPTAALKEVLEGLCADPKNIVFVVSGKEIHAVSEFFGRIKGLNLGAEHGFYYYWPDNGAPAVGAVSPVTPRGENKWKTMLELREQQWKDAVKTVMDVYVQRTHGTYIEQKGHALIWQYRDADPEFGYLQSRDLEENLSLVLSTFGGVDILRGGGPSDGYIEVRPSGISKGLFLEHVMAKLKSRDVYVDFLLTVGDDSSDEPMFQAVESLLSAKSAKPINAFSVTVGKKPTAARAYVDDPGAVMEMLVMLNKAMRPTASPRGGAPSELRSSKSEHILSSDKVVDGRPTLFVSAISAKRLSTTSIDAKAVVFSTTTLQQQQPQPSVPPTAPSRRVPSNRSFDRLAIEIQASTSLTASRSQLWRDGSTSNDEESTKSAPAVHTEAEDGEQDDGIFF